ncbi:MULTISPECIES: tRNA (guanosine(46)-N7)-methyltransferase TrmB [Thermus]|uniref:tRNA (guanine-N(7)-)-methyltransferase n=1 Tax=Thermus scotoductus (strain ATCC 700910 / SA-01) TaxID=743525 RepID=E8PPP5_THESS|nr:MULTISPECIES: tRNA (guanosine(46)-N7)-methyltransferase TrmB [Thermus]ADW22893.1 tRNA (guanine-N(7)-)-methyltransferase [Thermus scotoductus SA-01]
MLVRPALLPLWPPRVKDLFGREGPLVLEVGFGDGRFTAELAKAHPEWLILGAEVSAASVLRAYRRLKREGIGNVRLYHGQGPFALRNLVPPGSLRRVIVNFPDPWPKKRHQRKRLLQEGFFRRLSTRLMGGGDLLLTTDHEEYFRFALEEAKRSGLYRVEVKEPPEAHLRTKYALKWKEAGRTFFHAVFTKVAEDPTPWPPIRRYEVAHALLRGELPKELTLAKAPVAIPGGVAVFLEVARGEEGFYVLTHVEEEDLTQDLLLEVRRSAHGLYAGVSRFGSPLITEGVKEAVRALVQELGGVGLEVVQDHT